MALAAIIALLMYGTACLYTGVNHGVATAIIIAIAGIAGYKLKEWRIAKQQ